MAPSYNPVRDIPNLEGKVAIVTGGNSGLGSEIVRHLALKGAKVYMATRSEERARTAINRLENAGVPQGRIEFLQLNLGTIKHAKAAGNAFLEREERLDILINCGGMLASTYEVNEEGIFNSLATNHFGHFVLTTTLLPLMKKTALREGSDVRIVNVASTVYNLAPSTTSFASFESLNNVPQENSMNSQMARYGLSKLCNILFTRELQRRLDEEVSGNITAIAVHPGTVASDGSKTGLDKLPWPLSSIAWFVFRMLALTQEQGAYSSLFAATAPVVKQQPETYKASYIIPYNKLTPLKAPGNDNDTPRQLWELSEKKVAEILA